MRVKFGSIVVDGRGKLGGHVVSKGRTAHVLRTGSAKPMNRTKFQQQTRQSIGKLLNLWASLTSEQRKMWQEEAVNYEGSNVFGDTTIPTGKELFLRLNYNVTLLGYHPHFQPPPKATEGWVKDFNLISATTSKVEFSLNTHSATDVIIEATPPLKQSITRLKKYYRIVFAGFAPAGQPVNITTELTNRFGPLRSGQLLGLKITAINWISGNKFNTIQERLIIQP